MTGTRDIYNKPYQVFLGASEAFGNGVDYENTFAGIFAEYASRRGMEVLNMAIGGHYFLDQKELLKDFIRITQTRPSTVLFCVNALLLPKFDRAHKDIIVVGGNLFKRDNWRLNYLRLMLSEFSAGFCFFRDGLRKLEAKLIHYDPSRGTPEFLQIYAKSNPIHEPEKIRQFEADLAGFEHYCENNGINLIYVYLPLIDAFDLDKIVSGLGMNPTDYDAQYYERLMVNYTKKRGLRFVNLGPVLRDYHEMGLALKFDRDPHYNEKANQIIGEYLVRTVPLN